MNKLVVAINDEYSPGWRHLPATCKLFSNHIFFHRNPIVELSPAGVNANFDIFIDFSIHPNRTYAAALGNRYMPISRKTRTIQMLEIAAFNNTSTTTINTPAAYSGHSGSDDFYNGYIDGVGVPDCEKVLVKRQLGSRGEYQAVVPIHLLSSFVVNASGKTKAVLQEMFPTVMFSRVADEDEPVFRSRFDMFVCEYITDVVAEFRVLVGGDKVYARGRKIHSDGEYPQVGDRFEIQGPIEYTDLSSALGELSDGGRHTDTIRNFIDSIDFPYGSLDVYITASGELGMFEYSNEFGSHREDPRFFRQLHLDTIAYLVRQCDLSK